MFRCATFEKLQSLFDKEKDYMIHYLFEKKEKKTRARKLFISQLSKIS